MTVYSFSWSFVSGPKALVTYSWLWIAAAGILSLKVRIISLLGSLQVTIISLVPRTVFAALTTSIGVHYTRSGTCPAA